MRCRDCYKTNDSVHLSGFPHKDQDSFTEINVNVCTVFGSHWTLITYAYRSV